MPLLNWIQDNFVWIAGLSAGLKWIWEFSTSNKFNKNKFLVERIDKFDSLDSTKKVKKLLDWNLSKIEINGELVRVDDDFLIQSLRVHGEYDQFSLEESYLRKIFDEYFDGLEQLIVLSKTGIIDKENLFKFIEYWIDILKGKKQNKPKTLIETIHTYLKFYGYSELFKILK